MKTLKLTINPGLRYCFGFGSLAICLLFLHLPEVIAQSKQFLPVDKVAADFKAMLQRPSVTPRASFQTIKTDSVTQYVGLIHN